MTTFKPGDKVKVRYRDAGRTDYEDGMVRDADEEVVSVWVASRPNSSLFAIDDVIPLALHEASKPTPPRDLAKEDAAQRAADPARARVEANLRGVFGPPEPPPKRDAVTEPPIGIGDLVEDMDTLVLGYVEGPNPYVPGECVVHAMGTVRRDSSPADRLRLIERAPGARPAPVPPTLRVGARVRHKDGTMGRLVEASGPTVVVQWDGLALPTPYGGPFPFRRWAEVID